MRLVRLVQLGWNTHSDWVVTWDIERQRGAGKTLFYLKDYTTIFCGNNKLLVKILLKGDWTLKRTFNSWTSEKRKITRFYVHFLSNSLLETCFVNFFFTKKEKLMISYLFPIWFTFLLVGSLSFLVFYFRNYRMHAHHHERIYVHAWTCTCDDNFALVQATWIPYVICFWCLEQKKKEWSI